MNLGENKVTDLSYLREISGGDEDFIAEMITMFKTQCPEDLVAIQTAIFAKDHLSLRNAAHKMKSTVSTLGMKKAADLLLDIQEGANNKQDINELEGMFIEVKQMCSKAIEELS